MRLDDLSVAETEGGGSAEWLETWSRQRDWSQSQSQRQRQVRPGIRPTLNVALCPPPPPALERRLRGFVELSAQVHLEKERESC